MYLCLMFMVHVNVTSVNFVSTNFTYMQFKIFKAVRV